MKLYELGKKNYNSYNKPKANWNGNFTDFNPFGEDYQNVKKRSLEESLEKPKKALTVAQLRKIVKVELVKRGVSLLPITINTKGDLAKFYEIPHQKISEYLKN